MISIIDFHAGQRGDILASWLNGYTELTDIRNYCGSDKNPPARFKAEFSIKFNHYLANGLPLAELMSEYEQFLLQSPDKWHPSHYFNGPSLFANPAQFKLFRIYTEPEYLAEVAFNRMVKRPELIVDQYDTIRATYESFFEEAQQLISGRNRIITNGQKYFDSVVVSYQKIFKDFDSNYVFNIFGKHIDNKFIDMVNATTLPSTCFTAAGAVQLINNKLCWLD